METESQKSVSSVHLNMEADVSNKHVSTNCPSILRLLSIILIAYPILNSKPSKLFRIYFPNTNGAICRNRIFSSPKCRK